MIKFMRDLVLDDDFFPAFISMVITILILAGLSAIFLLIDGKHDDELWNNGHCPTCGSEWEYEQAVGHRYSTHYIYVCNGCGRRIEISDIR